MRKLVMMMVLALTAVGCGSVDDPPLGGAYGGTTGSTDPTGGQNPDQTGGGGGGSTGGGSTGGGGGGSTTDAGGGGGGGGSTDSGSSQTTTKDSGSQQTTQDSGSSQTQTAPTWSQIFSSYLKGSSTAGRCAGCHSQASSASNLYSWLQGKGYISGTSSPLVDPNQSCLSWYGGNMPPSGPSNANAVKDMNAWAAAGAQNN